MTSVPDDKARHRRPTITDVAERAGVAVGTVSRYLNGFEIRRGNRQEIESAIEALGFQRSAAAAAMKRDRSDVVGLLVPGFDAFHADLLNHLVRLFRQAGRTLLIYRHEDEVGLLREAAGFFHAQRVDALIMAGVPRAAEVIKPFVEQGIPVVIYNNDVDGPRVDRVFVDNAKASRRAVSHLVDLGHRRIALVQGGLADSSGRLRRVGYEQALAEHAIPMREDYVYAGNWDREGGYAAIQSFMALPEPPTAVFSANYQMTTGILEWLREHGRRTPDDLALVSFDDVDLLRLFDDGITAIAQPIAEIAETVASFVLSRLASDPVPDIRLRTIDCNIILRGSSTKAIGTKGGQACG